MGDRGTGDMGVTLSDTTPTYCATGFLTKFVGALDDNQNHDSTSSFLFLLLYDTHTEI